MSDVTCSKCFLPVNPNESGVRCYGFSIAHEENRCIYLLRQQLAERDAALARCVEALWSANESLWNNALNDAARKLEKVIASLPTSAQATAKVLETCRWVRDVVATDDVWDTGCGEMFVLNDGTPKKNGMVFCPYCSKAIREEKEGE